MTFGTPTMNISTVTANEDFAAMIVTDRNLSTLDVIIVPDGERSDARVRIVTNKSSADEFILVVG